MGIDNDVQADLYKEHIKIIIIQIKHFVWIRIYIINIILISTFNVFGSDIDKKSFYIEYLFVFTLRRSAFGIAVIISAIHWNHSDRHTYHRIMGRQPHTKRIGYKYKRKENGDQYSSYPGYNHHPLPKNVRYIQFRHYQGYQLFVPFRRDCNDSSVGRGPENSVDRHVLYRKYQSRDGVVDERH